MSRPFPIYDRKKNVRTWKKENQFLIEAYFEDAVHFIIVFLTVHTQTKTIKSVQVQFLRCPYNDLCPKTSKNYDVIIGLKIEKGFNKQISQLMANEKACVHVHSLLRDCADAFAQTEFKLTAKDLEGAERRKWLRSSLRNVCLAYSDEYNQD